MKRAGLENISEVTSKVETELMRYRYFGESMYKGVQEKLNPFDSNLDIKKLIYDEYKDISFNIYSPYFKEKFMEKIISCLHKKIY